MAIEEAVALIEQRVSVTVESEPVALGQADGRISAENICATGDLPPFNNAAVDGYAVRHALLAPGRETVLRLGARLAAGASAEGVLAGDGVVRIFTGAPMPRDTETVFMQEDVRVEGDHIVLPPGLKAGANCRLAGEDVPRGGLVIPEGRRLRPQDLALAAAVGCDALTVRRRLRVALFSTGDELTELGSPLRPGTIRDSNRVMLAALLRRIGVEVVDLGILRDDPATLPARLAAAAADHDLILTSGGVSAGEEDHVKAAVEAVGSLVFWRLAIRPGRPVAMGLIDHKPFVGLPGNPVAAYVTLLFVVRPLLARLAGETFVPPMAQPVRSAFTFRKRAGRREFLRVSLALGADGVIEARKFPKDGTGMLTSLTESDGLAELPDGAPIVSEGDIVGFYPHETLW